MKRKENKGNQGVYAHRQVSHWLIEIKTEQMTKR